LAHRAWLRATCPDEKHRDGNQAVADAKQACESSSWKNMRHLDTLAAAYAETGDFIEAVKWQEQAITLASPALKSEYEARLALYRDQQPYREHPKANPEVD
jgi:hypothetical protein